MSKAAIILNVDVNNNQITVYYESGHKRTWDVENVPKTVKSWMEKNQEQKTEIILETTPKTTDEETETGFIVENVNGDGSTVQKAFDNYQDAIDYSQWTCGEIKLLPVIETSKPEIQEPESHEPPNILTCAMMTPLLIAAMILRFLSLGSQTLGNICVVWEKAKPKILWFAECVWALVVNESYNIQQSSKWFLECAAALIISKAYDFKYFWIESMKFRMELITESRQ